MAVELERSAILEEVAKIQATGGSPYYAIKVVVHAGGKDVIPLQCTRMDVGRDYRTALMDDTSINLAFGMGTVINDLSPFQDDLKITITVMHLTATGGDITTQIPDVRTYRAYFSDDIPRATEAGNNPAMHDNEDANRSKMMFVTFTIEETACEQLRKQTVGTVASGVAPHMVVQAILSNACRALKLGDDEVISGLDVVQPNNTMPRAHVVIRDNTPILEVPDLVQNEQGGIYSSCLGFYLQGRFVYLWPLYDVTRQDSARRLLQITLSPNKQSTMLDLTWRQAGRMTSIYSTGVTKIVDNTTGALNTKGNAVRYTDASKLLTGMGVVKDNKFTASRGENNSEYATTVVGNGQNYAKTSDTAITSNPYLEASKMARNSGAIAVLPWKRSNPELLTPGMPTEILYDFNGDIRTISGVLIGAWSSYEMEGTGLQSNRYTSSTSIMIFIDRSDPDYQAYIQGGGGPSPVPEIGAL